MLAAYSGNSEPVEALARLLSLLVFVRPGDLYDNSYDIDIQGYALSIMQSLIGQSPIGDR